MSRRTVGRGHPSALDEERAPILGDRGGGRLEDNGAVGSHKSPESPLWGSGEV